MSQIQAVMFIVVLLTTEVVTLIWLKDALLSFIHSHKSLMATICNLVPVIVITILVEGCIAFIFLDILPKLKEALNV